MDRGLQKAAANLLKSTLTRLLRLNSQEMKSAKQLPQQKLPQKATARCKFDKRAQLPRMKPVLRMLTPLAPLIPPV